MTSSTNTLGKYQIVREIARSNDIVYEAIDPTIDRRIALKELCIPPNLQGAQRRERIERFWREGRAAGKLSHPNIVTVFEVGKDGERYFIAMEYLEGQTLREMLQAGGPLTLRDATKYMFQLMDALSYAHRNGVVHRDIKPENVQILPGNHVKLTDFGIARLVGEPSITQDGQVFGTPSYMSPEQVSGKDIDQRSDIFSLGVIFYEMLTGKKPFAGDSVVTITYNIMNMEPPPIAGVPPYVNSVIRKAMAKDANMRYSSIDEMAEDLREQKAVDAYDLDMDDPAAYPSPFGGVPQPPQQSSQSYQGPLTPYGTPMPSPQAGTAPDPFAYPGPVSPRPAPQSVPNYSTPKPVMSAETRNFLGVFLLVAALAGMLVFAIWAVSIAYDSYKSRSGLEDAGRYYEQGQRLFEEGDTEAALDQWRHAVRVSPESDFGKKAAEAIYNIRVHDARVAYENRNAGSLKSVAEELIDIAPGRPEGYFYLAAALHIGGDISGAKEHFSKSVQLGGNDDYAQAARRVLVDIYVREGDKCIEQGQTTRARIAYQNAVQYADANTLQMVQDRLSKLR